MEIGPGIEGEEWSVFFFAGVEGVHVVVIADALRLDLGMVAGEHGGEVVDEVGVAACHHEQALAVEIVQRKARTAGEGMGFRHGDAVMVIAEGQVACLMPSTLSADCLSLVMNRTIR